MRLTDFLYFPIEIREEKYLLGQLVHSLLVILLCLFISSKGCFTVANLYYGKGNTELAVSRFCWQMYSEQYSFH